MPTSSGETDSNLLNLITYKSLICLTFKNRTFGAKYRASEKTGLEEEILACRLAVGVQSFEFC